MRLEDGEIVYQYILDSTWNYIELSVYENIEKNRLYLFDNEYRINAVEIDTEFWTEIAQINGLRGVMNDDILIVQNDNFKFQFQQRYDLNTLIKRAEEILDIQDTQAK